MSKHLIKIDNPQHCAMSVAHAGKDNQYCEAGEVVAIDWQPSAGWGLQEAHYTDEDGNVVDIDLTLREFTMPAKAVTIGGTAKRFVLPDWKGADAAINAVSVSHSDLLAAIAAGSLETGTWYRITDYTCTTTQENTQSAGHQFDIVVMALDGSHLCETAFAAHHDGDTYFANSDLSAWVLKYSIENDTDRFAWADEENGKGVVFGMVDEFGNDLPYDFKNIQFLRHKKDLDNVVNGAQWLEDEQSAEALVVAAANSVASLATANKTVKSFLYGFENIVTASDISGLLEYEGIQYEDDDQYAVLYSSEDYGYGVVAKVLDDTKACYTFHADNDGDASLLASNGIEDNVIGIYRVNGAMTLPNGVMFGTNHKKCTVGNDCSYWTCGNSCFSWTCGNDCSYWTCGNDCSYWTCGNSCSYWTCGNSCSSWTCGNDCSYWTCGNSCSYWETTSISSSQNNPLKYFHLLDGVQGEEGDPLDLGGEGLQANKDFSQYVGLKTNGTLHIWNPADGSGT